MAYDYINSTGVIVPDTGTLEAEVIAEWRDSFGQDLAVTPDTPQGVMITGEVIAREGVTSNNAALANQINPNNAGGVFLDAIAALMGLERTAETATRVPGVVLGGVPQTVIPAGARGRSDAGDVYATAGGVTLDNTGSATVDMIAVEAGPKVCPAGTLVTVVDTVLGWETITNPLAGIIGNLEQSDTSLRQLRRDTLARQGISLREAQLSALNDIDGVLSAVFRENYTDTDATIDGVFLKKKSVWACVDGGTDAEVAGALLRTKTAGADWNGAVTVPVVDEYSGQTYPVKFDRATLVPVFMEVTVRRGTDLADPVAVVPDSIVRYARGEIPNDRGLVVGASVSPFEVASAVNFYHPGFTVTDVKLSVSGGTPATAVIPMTLKQRALVDASYVTVFVLP